MPVALITGGSAGLGRALVTTLASKGWHVITDARDAERLATAGLPEEVVTVAGDITDDGHKRDLVDAVRSLGRLDLLIHNASSLGPLPMRALSEIAVDDLQNLWRTNVGAPLILTGELAPWLTAANGIVVGISSDAAVAHYENWGLYGASKAALDHLVQTYAAELDVTGYAFDPGDMRTQMHQDAFPGEDISDRPEPESVVPALLTLIDQRPTSGRYRASEIALPAPDHGREEVAS